MRERRGLAYYVFGLNHSYTDAGSLYTQAGVDINRIDEAVTTIAAELRKIAAEPVPADELEKARSFSKGRFVLQLESPQGLIVYGLRKEVLEGRAPDPEEILAGIDAVTAEDVQRVARDVIADDRAAARADRSVRGRRALRRAARLRLAWTDSPRRPSTRALGRSSRVEGATARSAGRSAARLAPRPGTARQSAFNLPAVARRNSCTGVRGRSRNSYTRIVAKSASMMARSSSSSILAVRARPSSA